ncbi:MAG TPA: glycosyltransferase family A protein [Burkholderiales bacterium]|nr:glycosyltransferase family A protein [Burkholderiales bacterium]
MKPPQPLISVVIPTWRRPPLLRRCLDAVLTQRYDPARYEVIVCDDGPDAATHAVIETLRVDRPHGPRIRYLPVTATQGPAAARNVGWRAAHGTIIAFTDDDTLPDAHWLAAGERAMRDGADAAAGRVIMPLRAAPTDYERDAAGLAGAEFVTANCFVRRSALKKVGGFDERFTAAWREDSDLQFSLLEAGARIVRADDAVVCHPVRPGRWGASIGQQRKARFNALLYKKHPALYRARIAQQPPWLYYGIVAALAAGVYGGRRNGLAGAAVPLGAWALLSGCFCARRLRDTSRRPAHVLEMVCTSALIPPLSVFWRLRGALRFRVRFL